MFKRLITWLYERYCQEKPLTAEQYKVLKARFELAKELARPFRMAAWDGQSKPEYPQYKGGECPQALKEMLDEIYEKNKPKKGTLFGNFANMPVNCERMPLKPTQIYETSQEVG